MSDDPLAPVLVMTKWYSPESAAIGFATASIRMPCDVGIARISQAILAIVCLQDY